MIRAVVFDFGGVIAEEGFREGLKAIGEKNGLNPEAFYVVASELVYQAGYVTGVSSESAFWNAVRNNTGVAGDDEQLRSEILKRFVLRPEVLEIIAELRVSGLLTAILSDQTNWLDEINEITPFFHYFDYVFNSFKLHKGKRDPSIFRDVCSDMGLSPWEALFVDDNAENIERALSEGLKAIHFKKIGGLKKEIETIVSRKSLIEED